MESLCDKLVGANDLADTQPVYQTSLQIQCRSLHEVRVCVGGGWGGGGGGGGGGGMESKTLPFLRGKVMSVLAQMLS